MNIFSVISGKKGEQLTSALLRFLVLNSMEIREKIIDVISYRSPIGSISSDSYFSCSPEEIMVGATKKGRLDLYIETDNAVIGIENKLGAPFQHGQPDDYVDWLHDRAKQLGKVRSKKYRAFLVIIAPAHRTREVNDRIRRSQHPQDCVLVAWDDLLEKLANASDYLSLITKAFVDYVAATISTFHNFHKWGHHLWLWQRSFKDSADHDRFMKMLPAILKQDGRRNYSKSAGSIGYYFYWEPGQHTGWIGFVSKRHLAGSEFVGDHQAELVITTTLDVDASKLTNCEPVTLVNCNGWYADHNPNRKRFTWRIDVRPDRPEWSRIGRWHDLLRPFNDTVQKRVGQLGASSISGTP
ncbi:MAG: PD-(D/E)XK nuclease family protein [Gammaproteobacteria bacterium]